MPRIINFADDDDGPLDLYAPLRDPPAPDSDGAATLRALDALRSVGARSQPGYGTVPGGVLPPEAPAASVLDQVVPTSNRQQVQYPQEADAWPMPGALDGQNDGVIGPEPATDDANAPTLYAQLRQQQRRPPPVRQRPPRRPVIAPPLAPRRPVPQRQAPPQSQVPGETYPPPGIMLPPPPASPLEDPSWGQVPQLGQRPIGNGATDPQLRRTFADRIAWAERSSGYGGIGEPTRSGARALGRYQFLPRGLVAAGVLGQDGQSWAGPIARQFGIHSRDDFLNSPAAQEAALRAFLRSNQRRAAALGLDRYVGRVIDGVRGQILITYPGLMAAAHRVGPDGVSTYLRGLEEDQNGGLHSRGRTLSDLDAAAETRLRVFMNEHYSTD